MCALGLVELQGACERLEYRLRHPGGGAAFEAGVVVDADAGKERDLLTSESRHASIASEPGQARVLGCDPGPPRGQELAHLVPRVHGTRVAPPAPRGTASTSIDRAGHRPRVVLECRHESNGDVRRGRRPGRERPRRPADRADRRARTRHPRRDLRQRSLAVQVDGADRVRPPHGPRVHRRRRGRRRRRPDGQDGRPRRLAVPVVGRHLRLLPRRAAERVPTRRQVRLRRRRRRPGRGGARAAGGRHARRAAGRRGRRAHARRCSRSPT